ncbi:MAG: DUF3634 family protein [Gemmataceae bacterium]|nr:DUF3634 family protein [Gemmataceae bacterium]MCI0738210.1 DUF3634 family protein [Gemmataceae bacterium]
MKRIKVAIAALFAMVAVAAGMWLYQAWIGAGLQKEWEAQALKLERQGHVDWPSDSDVVFGRKIGRAEQVQRVCVVSGALAGSAAIFGLYWLRTLAFFIVVSNGVAQVQRGKATAAFVEEVRACCHEAGIGDAEIWGKRFAGRMRLGFSRSVPKNVRQRIRNLYVRRHGAQTAPTSRRKR